MRRLVRRLGMQNKDLNSGILDEVKGCVASGKCVMVQGVY
jgi:hypothetical protein